LDVRNEERDDEGRNDEEKRNDYVKRKKAEDKSEFRF
jgi:hypothetical protein